MNKIQKNKDVDKKIPGTKVFVTTTILHAKINEIENKIPNTSNLVTKIILYTKIRQVENKISDNSIYITTQKCDMLMTEKSAARLKPADQWSILTLIKKVTSFNKRITSNKTKHLEVQKKLNSLITKD